jgi:hypothetical protein
VIVSVVENGERRSLSGVRIDIRLSQLRAMASLGPSEYDFGGVWLVVKEDPPAPPPPRTPVEEQ